MWVEEFQDSKRNTKYRFYERYVDPMSGKRKRTSVVMNKDTRPSQKEAQRLLNERIEKKVKASASHIPGLDDLTFHQVAHEWFERYQLTSGSKRGTMKEKRSKLNGIYRAFDADILFKNLNTRIIQDFIDDLHHREMSRGSITGYLSVIKFIIKFGERNYHVKSNVAVHDIEVPVKTKTIEEIKSKRNNYLEMDEVKKILEYIDYKIKNNKRPDIKRNLQMMRYIIEFQVLNGMRISELLAIQNHNVDLDNKKLEIDGSIIWEKGDDGFGIKDTTKTEKSYRVIDLTDRSCEILKKAMLDNKKEAMWSDRFQDKQYVFTSVAGTPLFKEKVNVLLKEAAEWCGIDKKITSHTLRHTHISLLSQLGGSLKAIMERVGHTDHKTTLRIYTHVTQQMNKDLMNKLEKVVI